MKNPEFKLKRTISLFGGETLADGTRLFHFEDRNGNTSDEDISPENIIKSPRLLPPLPLIRSRSEPVLNVYCFFSPPLNPTVADFKAGFNRRSNLFQPKKNSAHRVKSDENINRHQKNQESVNPFQNLSVEL